MFKSIQLFIIYDTWYLLLCSISITLVIILYALAVGDCSQGTWSTK